MDSSRKTIAIDQITSEIIYARYSSKLYRLVAPTKEQRALANLIYKEALNDNKFENILTRESATALLQQRNIWTVANETQLKQVEKSLEDLKIKLYKAVYNKREQKNILRSIKRTEKVIEKSLMKKFSLDNYTLEFFAEKVREEFLIALCIQDRDGNYIYGSEDYSSSNNLLLSFFLNIKYNNQIKAEEYREIARTEPFRSLWSVGKEQVFGRPIIDITDEQRTLILYCKMYDNVYEHPERPSDEVIDNDYMLDGWFALQRKEADQDRKAKEADALLNKKGKSGHGDADELFVLAESQEEANRIRDLNDLNTDMTVKQRIAAVKESGKLDEQDLPDVKRDLMNQARRQAMKK